LFDFYINFVYLLFPYLVVVMAMCVGVANAWMARQHTSQYPYQIWSTISNLSMTCSLLLEFNKQLLIGFHTLKNTTIAFRTCYKLETVFSGYYRSQNM
jgi:hypothetical protein